MRHCHQSLHHYYPVGHKPMVRVSNIEHTNKMILKKAPFFLILIRPKKKTNAFPIPPPPPPLYPHSSCFLHKFGQIKKSVGGDNCPP